MNDNQLLIGLLLGCLPYRVEREHQTGGERALEMRALFWTLTIHRCWDGQRDWTLRVPLIDKARDAIWAAVLRLRDQPPPGA